MLKFIVCEDNEVILKNNCAVINKVMMNNNYDYVIEKFTDYDQVLKNTFSSPGSKIYILDIELPSKSGIDIAREIREQDTDSIIIMSSVYESLANRIFRNRLMILAFLSKFDNHDYELEKMLHVALQHFNKKRMLIVERDGASYYIRQQDILYITTDTVERKVIIRTIDDEFITNRTLSDVEMNLDDNFMKSHKSCIVNMTMVKCVDYKNCVITFINKEKLPLLSRTYKKGIRNWVKV